MSQVSGYNAVDLMSIIRGVGQSFKNNVQAIKEFVQDITNSMPIENYEDISEIIKAEDRMFISTHEKQIQKVFIPLDNTQESIVQKTTVSEKLAAQNAEIKVKNRQQEQLQRQRGDE